MYIRICHEHVLLQYRVIPQKPYCLELSSFFYLKSQYQNKEYENLMIRMKCLFSNKDITGGIMFGGCDDLRDYCVC